MGKIDDMRRQREQQFAAAGKGQAKATKAQSVDVDAAVAKAAAAGADADRGKCPDCGKMKPLSNGVMASHQKGFGKACPGSRKTPA